MVKQSIVASRLYMRTTDNIIEDLHKRAEAGEDVRQQVIAHETLARLRSERVDAVEAEDTQRVHGLDSQIRYWLTLVDRDVDQRIVEEPRKDSAKLVLPANDPAEPAPKA